MSHVYICDKILTIGIEIEAFLYLLFHEVDVLFSFACDRWHNSSKNAKEDTNGRIIPGRANSARDFYRLEEVSARNG